MTDCLCEYCGAKIIKYWHRLNKPLVAALIRCYHAKQFTPFSLKEIELSHEQRCNFQKLKYWGFIQKDVLGWRITNDGFDFISGKISCSDRIQTFRDKSIDQSDNFIHVQNVIEGYQWKDDYLKEAEFGL